MFLIDYFLLEIVFNYKYSLHTTIVELFYLLKIIFSDCIYLEQNSIENTFLEV